MHKHRNILTIARTASLACVLIAAGACGSDSITDPTYGSGCNVGSIAPGQVRHSSLTESSCLQSYSFWSNGRIPYESWTVQLTAGKAYLFYEAQEPDAAHGGRNDVDALLTLYGKNESGVSVPLALSDDDGEGIDGHDAQIYFVAPVSGSYQLVAASYWGDEYGGYRLEAHECTVIATLDTAGTYDLTLGTASACTRIAPASTAADTATWSMIRIPAAAGEAIGVTITSAAFVPTWEMFGPGFDTYGNIYSSTDSDEGRTSGASGGVTLGELAGDVTLGIGGDMVTSAGSFTVVLTRTPPAAPPIGAAPWSVGRIALAARKTPPAKSH